MSNFFDGNLKKKSVIVYIKMINKDEIELIHSLHMAINNIGSFICYDEKLADFVGSKQIDNLREYYDSFNKLIKESVNFNIEIDKPASLFIKQDKKDELLQMFLDDESKWNKLKSTFNASLLQQKFKTYWDNILNNKPKEIKNDEVFEVLGYIFDDLFEEFNESKSIVTAHITLAKNIVKLEDSKITNVTFNNSVKILKELCNYSELINSLQFSQFELVETIIIKYLN